MLIKLQKTRFSTEYMVIENARHVTYRDKPLMLPSEMELRDSMSEFMDHQEDYQRSCWYQLCDPALNEYELDFSNGYFVNEMSYIDSEGLARQIRFDGEAYLCNDEGKTIHRIKTGGCPSVFRPIQKAIAPRPLLPKAA